ncbi:MAG TPA: NAD(P)/FAD-dependent oxidoreductase [Acidimicrobiales bacterium]|nr:NAD(P)/FAD-dependent oxidoreductase [Acidimicrobiales bacterium]
MEVDAVVVGLGPGGEQVAEDLADAGLQVVGIEADLVGGECPYWGCIPSKAMVRAAELLAEGRRIPGRAGTADVTPDWAPVARRVREVTGSWDDRAAVERLESKGGRFVRGRARLNAPSSVDVGGTTITARRALVLATGQRAWVPPMFEPVPHWTNRELIESESVPASLLVIGGGSVGLELGQVMQRFGAAVSIVEAGPRLAASEEPEASELITDVLRGDGVDVHTGVAIERVEPYGPTGAQVELAGGNVLRGERMLVATGRRSDLRALGVGALGLDEDARSLPVDGRMRVAPGVWAVGDVTGKGAFTHVAVYQARLCVADILGRPRPDADYRALPRVTFTDPEVGSVGLTEEQARREGGDVAVLRGSVADSARGWLHGADGFVKLVARDGVVVGGTAMCPYGGEVFSMLALAVHAELTLETLRTMIFAYPTFHRAVDSALWSPNNAAKIAGA